MIWVIWKLPVDFSTVPSWCFQRECTVPSGCFLHASTVPSWCFLCDGTVPSRCFLCDSTVPSYNHYLNFRAHSVSQQSLGLVELWNMRIGKQAWGIWEGVEFKVSKFYILLFQSQFERVLHIVKFWPQKIYIINLTESNILLNFFFLQFTCNSLFSMYSFYSYDICLRCFSNNIWSCCMKTFTNEICTCTTNHSFPLLFDILETELEIKKYFAYLSPQHPQYPW